MNIITSVALDVSSMLNKAFYRNLRSIKYVSRNRDRTYSFWFTNDRPVCDVKTGEWIGHTGFDAENLLDNLYIDKRQIINELPKGLKWTESLMTINLQ